MIDIGLVSAQLGLSAIKSPQERDLFFTNKGGLAEQFVGQQLRSTQTPSTDPQLFTGSEPGGDSVKSIISFNMEAGSSPWK